MMADLWFALSMSLVISLFSTTADWMFRSDYIILLTAHIVCVDDQPSFIVGADNHLYIRDREQPGT